MNEEFHKVRDEIYSRKGWELPDATTHDAQQPRSEGRVEFLKLVLQLEDRKES